MISSNKYKKNKRIIKIDICFKKLVKFIEKNCKKYHYHKDHHRRKHKLKEMIYSVFYYSKYAIPWNHVINNIPGATVYSYYKWLVNNNILFDFYINMLQKYLSTKERKKLSILMTDTSFSNNRYGTEKIGRNKFNKNKNSNKISFLTDLNGVPVSILIKEGNIHDSKFILEHFDNLLFPPEMISDNKPILLADSAYDGKNIRETLAQKVVPIIDYNKRNTKNKDKLNHLNNKEKRIYKKRIKVENTFSWLKNNRRCLNRYDRLFKNYLNSILIGVIYILINKIPMYLLRKL